MGPETSLAIHSGIIGIGTNDIAKVLPGSKSTRATHGRAKPSFLESYAFFLHTNCGEVVIESVVKRRSGSVRFRFVVWSLSAMSITPMPFAAVPIEPRTTTNLVPLTPLPLTPVASGVKHAEN